MNKIATGRRSLFSEATSKRALGAVALAIFLAAGAAPAQASTLYKFFVETAGRGVGYGATQKQAADKFMYDHNVERQEQNPRLICSGVVHSYWQVTQMNWVGGLMWRVVFEAPAVEISDLCRDDAQRREGYFKMTKLCNDGYIDDGTSGDCVPYNIEDELRELEECR